MGGGGGAEALFGGMAGVFLLGVVPDVQVAWLSIFHWRLRFTLCGAFSLCCRFFGRVVVIFGALGFWRRDAFWVLSWCVCSCPLANAAVPVRVSILSRGWFSVCFR